MSIFLLVDDDIDLGVRLKEYFAPKGITLEVVTSGEGALTLLSSHSFDLILLDWNLGGTIDGLAVCDRYRKSGGHSYIIFLTGEGQLNNKEMAFQAGGDDYLVKPFDVRELNARIGSLMRRSLTLSMERLSIRNVSLDPATRKLTAGANEIKLGPKESELLEYLMRHPNRPFSAQKLLSAIWSSETDASEGTVRTFMFNLRNKLTSVGQSDFIKTVVSSGYVIENDEPSRRNTSS